jgi:hypothetical protein
LRQIKAGQLVGRDNSLMADVFFRCPVTGMSIHHLVDDDQSLAQETGYESVECPACLRLHLIDTLTGELASEKGETSPSIVP